MFDPDVAEETKIDMHHEKYEAGAREHELSKHEQTDIVLNQYTHERIQFYGSMLQQVQGHDRIGSRQHEHSQGDV